MTRTTIRGLALAAALSGAAIGASPAAAQAASTCVNDLGGPGGFTQTATIIDRSGTLPLRIVRQGKFIAFSDGLNGGLSFCDGPTGFATIDTINFIHVIGSPAAKFDSYVYDQSGGAFGPGLTTETDGRSEIETLITTAGGTTALTVKGTSGPDTMRVSGGGGVMIGNDGDVDLRYREASEITVFGGASDDFISGRGGASQSPSTVRVHLSGDAGRDTVVDGPFVLDDVFGGSEDDTLFTQDGRLDSVRGDAGFDKATVDSIDTVDTVEQKIVGGVGRLQLARRTMRTGADGSARLDFAWAHPESWKRLRAVEVRLYDNANRVVGRITVKPRGERVTARDAVAVTGSRIAHHGRKVNARLRVRPAARLAGQDLRVDVGATDRDGSTQVEPDAGVMRVAA